MIIYYTILYYSILYYTLVYLIISYELFYNVCWVTPPPEHETPIEPNPQDALLLYSINYYYYYYYYYY